MPETTALARVHNVSSMDKKQLAAWRKDQDKERRSALSNDLLRTAAVVLTHPVFALVGGFVIIEVLQRYPRSEPIMGGVSGTVLEGALVSGTFAAALGSAAAPIVAALAKGGVG
ncbi:hypothetical protein LCGC14_1615870 [marine sediment metagenome]|uniref:Uncharacterized protein n=1 Tax=marine sediment metagenome TaxID=412755 RepID=A0A0F9I767_9ZZZZ